MGPLCVQAPAIVLEINGHISYNLSSFILNYRNEVKSWSMSSWIWCPCLPYYSFGPNDKDSLAGFKIATEGRGWEIDSAGETWVQAPGCHQVIGSTLRDYFNEESIENTSAPAPAPVDTGLAVAVAGLSSDRLDSGNGGATNCRGTSNGGYEPSNRGGGPSMSWNTGDTSGGHIEMHTFKLF